MTTPSPATLSYKPDVPSPTNPLEARAFFDRGLITPVAAGTKAGRLKKWNEPGFTVPDGEWTLQDNVGLLTGNKGTVEGVDYYVLDVDIDVTDATERRLIHKLLPPTGWRFGRASKPDSHFLYATSGTPVASRRFKGTDKKVIIELRGVTQDGKYNLTVAPGSTHESGEAIRFAEPRRALNIVTPEEATHAVEDAATAVVIFRVWPHETGSRHELRLAFAKVLLEHGLSEDRVVRLLEAVMDVSGSNARDVRAAVRDTKSKLDAGQDTFGASKILDVLGDDGRPALSTIERILERADGGKGIVMVGGKLSEVVDRAQVALLGAGVAIYQRGGILTRPIKLDRRLGEALDVRRDVGSTILAAVREPWLLEQMGRVSPWYRVTADGKRRRADPEQIYARTLLGRGEWNFPVLRGVVTSPTLDRQGRIIETPGFDEASGLLIDIPPDLFPPVPTAPTQDDAFAALERLGHPLRGFPFVDDASRSVALSALLTAMVRSTLRTAPLHGFDAPTAGTGKSMLAELAGLLATGVRPPALSQGRSAEEDEKRLSTVLFAGDPVIHLDNCERPISGDFLCSMLTQEVVQARVLGLSERRVLPSTALILASGNNLTFAGDTSRRAVVCRLDAKVERPDTREFDFDCHAEVLASRAELVVAGLTVLRAYAIAGRPVLLTPMGSFTDWEWIRGALVWLGCADPADTRSDILDSDPRKDELLEVMDLWHEAFEGSRVEVSEIAAQADPLKKNEPAIALHAKLVEVACHGGKWSGKSVGWWLRRHKERVVGDRCFRCVEKRTSKQHWFLAARNAPEPAVPDEQAEISMSSPDEQHVQDKTQPEPF